MEYDTILKIAKKEIMNNIRNFWIIIITIIYAIFILLFSYLGTIVSQELQSIEVTVSLMMIPIRFIVPIVGLILGHGCISGEIEMGSMSALLSLPVKRFEIILGKFLGLSSVIAFTIIVGFGIAGIIIGLNYPDTDYLKYLLFICGTVLVGIVFCNMAMFFSTIFKSRVASIIFAIFLWIFFVFGLQLILAGVLVASVGLGEVASGNIPDWFHLVGTIDPMSAYSNFVGLLYTTAQASEIPISYPSYYTTEIMAMILFIWIFVLLFLSYLRFEKKDI